VFALLYVQAVQRVREQTKVVPPLDQKVVASYLPTYLLVPRYVVATLVEWPSLSKRHAVENEGENAEVWRLV
jgi:hypothetical protein